MTIVARKHTAQARNKQRVAIAIRCGWPVELVGRVVGITDGDTLTVLDAEHLQVRIRLAKIDAPERGQLFGTHSKQPLAGLAFGRRVSMVVADHDRYGRPVGRIYAGSVDVNVEMPNEPHC